MLVELYFYRKHSDRPDWPDGRAYIDQPLQLIQAMSVIDLYYQQSGTGDRN